MVRHDIQVDTTDVQMKDLIVIRNTHVLHMNEKKVEREESCKVKMVSQEFNLKINGKL